MLQNTTKVSFSLGFADARIMAPNYTSYDPGILKYANEESMKQFLTVQETYEKTATELQSLKPRNALVRYLKAVRHYWFWRKPAITIAKLKTPTVKTITSSERVQELREHYTLKYTRPAEEVIEEVSALLTFETDAPDDPPPFTSKR